MKSEFNAFISYAFEDKTFASEIVGALTSSGISVWYAEIDLKVGDKLLDAIENGLRNSDFGILLISPDYLKKGWTNYEMDTLIRQSIEKNKKLLPIWHGVTKEDVEKRHTGLSGVVSLRSDIGIRSLSMKLVDVISASAPTIGVIPSWEKPTHRFLEGLGEINLDTHKGVCTTIWEFLLWADDSEYPLAISGECFTKQDLLLRVAQIIPHAPERVKKWVNEDGYKKIWAMCKEAGIDPAAFE